MLGVDDLALRKGDSCATILVDLKRRRPVNDRDAEPLAAWLKGHPEVEIICRDRAGAYAEAARSAAPQTVQVADAWYLWHNLGEAVEKTVSAHHSCVRTAFENTLPAAPPTSDDIWQTPPPPSSASGTLDVCGRERRLVTRSRERYAAVQQFLDDGSTLEHICRTLQLDRSTVRRFARATSIDELLVKAANRSTTLDECAPPPPAVERGPPRHCPAPPGERRPGLRRKHPDRPALPPPVQGRHRRASRAPSGSTAAPYLPLDHDRSRKLTADDAAGLKEVRAGCPELDAVTRHVRDFAAMMRDLRGDQLPVWMEGVLADDLPTPHSLVNGLSRDIDAVTAGLSTPWSSGQAEGRVTRTKLLKRQGFGRVNLDFLRKRVPLRP
ncbi:transposase [Streptomyces ehimensis]|uniref:Transposase n=1 Tax=Streptomyces ehimensis TaxID=68195 RepID=A0ABV9BSZ9_9ACTN